MPPVAVRSAIPSRRPGRFPDGASEGRASGRRDAPSIIAAWTPPRSPPSSPTCAWGFATPHQSRSPVPREANHLLAALAEALERRDAALDPALDEAALVALELLAEEDLELLAGDGLDLDALGRVGRSRTRGAPPGPRRAASECDLPVRNRSRPRLDAHPGPFILARSLLTRNDSRGNLRAALDAPQGEA